MITDPEPRQFLPRGVIAITGSPTNAGLNIVVSDEEALMRKMLLLIAAAALILCSVDVWAGGSRTDTTDDAAVFVISNAL